jgi:hypothetical protein
MYMQVNGLSNFFCQPFISATRAISGIVLAAKERLNAPVERSPRPIQRVSLWPERFSTCLKLFALLFLLEGKRLVAHPPARQLLQTNSLLNIDGTEETNLNEFWVDTDFFPTSVNGTSTIEAFQLNTVPLPAGLSVTNQPMVQVGTIPSAGNFEMALANNRYLYAIVSSNLIEVFDLITPTNPQLVRTFQPPLSSGTQNLICANSTCFLLPENGPDDLLRFDGSNPVTTTFTPVINFNGTSFPLNFAVDEERAYGVVANAIYSPISSTYSLQLITVNLTYGYLGSYNFNPSMDVGMDYFEIALTFPLALLLLQNPPTLYIFNISNLLTPMLVNTFSYVPPGTDEVSYISIVAQQSLCVVGLNVPASSLQYSVNGLLIDLSDGASPQVSALVTSMNFLGPYSLALYGPLLYTTDYQFVSIFNIKEPTAPYIVSSTPFTFVSNTAPLAIIFLGNYLYLGGQTLILTRGATFGLTGTPKGGTRGNYTLIFNSVNPGSTPLLANLQINPAITAIPSLPPALALVGQFFNAILPSGAFQSTVGNQLFFSALQNNGAPLPSGIEIDGITGALSGTPVNAADYLLSVTAFDLFEANATTLFPLTVVYPIEAQSNLQSRLGLVGVPFNFTLGNSLFSNPAMVVLNYSCSSNDDSLPAWIGVDFRSFFFFGTPPLNAIGTFPITIQAIDPHQLISSTFFIFTIQQVIPPFTTMSLVSQTASVGTRFSYQVPSGLFYSSIGGTIDLAASFLPGWLSFDPLTNMLEGTPATTDQSLNHQTTYQLSISGVLSYPSSSVMSSSSIPLSINLVGNSVLDIALEAIGYSALGISVSLLLYRFRRIFYTNCLKSYHKTKVSATTGNPFQYPFSTPQEQIRQVKILFLRSKTQRCCRFLEWSSTKLEGTPLPEGNLIYDRFWNHVDTPQLASFDATQFFLIAYGDGEVIKEQVEVTVIPDSESVKEALIEEQ